MSSAKKLFTQWSTAKTPLLKGLAPGSHPKTLFRMVKGGYLAPYVESTCEGGVLRQDFETLYWRTGAVYAMKRDIAMGGSTNTILHILAIAHEAGVNFTMKDIDALSRKIPCCARCPQIAAITFRMLPAPVA